jgi:DNA sulfur modification protein DndD
MILREVSLHNFGPFLGRHLLNLAPQSHVGNSPRSVTLIGALNGSGKTTLLDSIQLALYGARARCSSRKNVSYQDFLRQSIHTKAPKSEGASVGLEFDYPTPRGG